MLPKILDFAPAVAFFITYRVTNDLVFATGVIIACCLSSFILQYILWRKASRMQVFLTCAVLLFGLPTILLNDPQIIKLKVTVVNALLAIAILFCQYVLKKNPFSYLFGKEFPIPEHIWGKLGTSFAFYFIFIACLNMVIAFYLPTLFGIDEKHAESLWVDYKSFGNIILNCTFSLLLILFFYKRYPEMRSIFSDYMASKNENKDGSKLDATDAPEVAVATVESKDEKESKQ